MLIMHSRRHRHALGPGRYPGLSQRHPALIAAVLYRDHARGRDDASVRRRAAPPGAMAMTHAHPEREHTGRTRRGWRCASARAQIAALCGFGLQDQARIATAVSEIARNVYNYAAPGRVEFLIEGETAPQLLTIRIEDQGPGIADLDRILAGQYQSQTGMGVGLIGAQRLMDRFDDQQPRRARARVVELQQAAAGACAAAHAARWSATSAPAWRRCRPRRR